MSGLKNKTNLNIRQPSMIQLTSYNPGNQGANISNPSRRQQHLQDIRIISGEKLNVAVTFSEAHKCIYNPFVISSRSSLQVQVKSDQSPLADEPQAKPRTCMVVVINVLLWIRRKACSGVLTEEITAGQALGIEQKTAPRCILLLPLQLPHLCPLEIKERAVKQ